MRVLITGVSGFVGSHVLEYFLNTTEYEIVCLVRMSRAGNLNRLESVLEGYNLPKRVEIIRHDLRDPLDHLHSRIGRVDYIVHIAADSHVDDSIVRPVEVFTNNGVSTIQMLEYARKYQKTLKKFLYYSTDEVFGDAEVGQEFSENDVLNPRNPYSAGKASGEMIVNAYRATYAIPTLTMRTMNMFGERQDKEKFIPKIISNVLRNKPVPIHYFDREGDKLRFGSRNWLYAKNSASAILFMLSCSNDIKKVNVGSETELDNFEVASLVCKMMGKELRPEFVLAEKARPGYDRRYKVSDNFIKSLGWKSPFDFESALEQTIKFSMDNPIWVR